MASSQRQLRCADYHVAWICPVADVELLPARLMLDEEHLTPPYNTHFDENTYICGAINGHGVVVATCPPGETGNVNAGRLTGSMFKTFPNIRMAVLVGIGGGIPRLASSEDSLENIHLGDVVVGWPGDGKPACVYHDRGRSKPNGEFEMVGTMQNPDWRLINTLGVLATDYELGRTTFEDQLARLRGHKKFAHPGLEHDRLFRATYRHADRYSDSCITCDESELVQRPQRTEANKSNLVFHQGRIATGNAVIRDGELRDQIGIRCNGAICVEMEAAGVDVNRKCLIIRGISDYADSHKHDAWRSYAAGTAAAFTRELLCRNKPDGIRWEVQNLDHSISGTLTLMQADIRSIASTSLVTSDRFVEMMEKTNEMYQILRYDRRGGADYHGTTEAPLRGKSVQHPHSRDNPSERISDLTMSKNTVQMDVTLPNNEARSQTCGCPLNGRPVSYSYGFWGMTFQLDHQQPSKHRRECRLYGLHRKTRRMINAQIPLKLSWFFARTTHACIAYTNGGSTLGISVRLKNVVPRDRDPFLNITIALSISSIDWRSSKVMVKRLEGSEHEILSLYRQGRASPSDRNEMDQSHAQVFVSSLCNIKGFWEFSRDQSVTRVVLRLLETLVALTESEDEKLPLGHMLWQINYRLTQNHGVYSERVFSYILGTFSVDFSEGILNSALYGDISSALKDMPVSAGMSISPLARAIISRSLTDLKFCVLQNPTAPTEMLEGVTMIQLCIGWPQGLRELLTTKAKSLIDYSHSSVYGYKAVAQALEKGSHESVDLLMKAGCSFTENDALYLYMTTHECITAIAFNLANRRRSLLEIVQQELGIMQHRSPSDVADGTAAYLCRVLDDAAISIPTYLRVPDNYTTIYHSIPFDCFPTFIEQGFRDFDAHNELGLTAAMVWREMPCSDEDTQPIETTLLWLIGNKFLDQNPKDPWKLGLNIHATGWHYIAAMLCLHISSILELEPYQTTVRTLSSVSVRDSCVCWCNHGGTGCSPLKTLLIAHADEGRYNAISRHIHFHHNIRTSGTDDEIPKPVLELVRLLTFEALEMTHTCCGLEPVNVQEKRRFTDSEYEARYKVGNRFKGQPYVIVQCTPDRVEEIRSDEREQQNALQLDALMVEFVTQIKMVEPSYKAFETFINGYWRQRISDLYMVNPKVLNETGRDLEAVQTYVLPEGLWPFLGRDFALLRPSAQATLNEEESDEECGEDKLTESEFGYSSPYIEDIGIPNDCLFCGENPWWK